MLSMAEELAITARVNLEWGEARKRLSLNIIDVVLWAIRDTEQMLAHDHLPPYSKPQEAQALRAALAELRTVVESYERERGGGPAPSRQASEPC